MIQVKSFTTFIIVTIVTTNKSVHLIGHLPKGDNFTWSYLLSLYQLSPIEDLHFMEEFNLIKISYCNTLHSPKHLTEPYQRSCQDELMISQWKSCGKNLNRAFQAFLLLHHKCKDLWLVGFVNKYSYMKIHLDMTSNVRI